MPKALKPSAPTTDIILPITLKAFAEKLHQYFSKTSRAKINGHRNETSGVRFKNARLALHAVPNKFHAMCFHTIAKLA